MIATLKAPFPWFGGKSTIADVVWSRLGNKDIVCFLGEIQSRSEIK